MKYKFVQSQFINIIYKMLDPEIEKHYDIYKNVIHEHIKTKPYAEKYMDKIKLYLLDDLANIIIDYTNIYQLKCDNNGFGYLLNGKRVGKWILVETTRGNIRINYSRNGETYESYDSEDEFCFYIGNYISNYILDNNESLKNGEWCRVQDYDIIESTNYVNNMKHGKEIKWEIIDSYFSYDEIEISESCRLINHEHLDKPVKFLRFENNYNNNFINGEQIEWYDNGTKKCIINYCNGKKHGKTCEWTRTGVISMITKYDNDKIISNWTFEDIKYNLATDKTKSEHLYKIGNINYEICDETNINCLIDEKTNNIMFSMNYNLKKWKKMVKKYTVAPDIKKFGKS